MRIQKNILLKEYTTFRVGGPAKYFVVIRDTEDLKQAVNFAKQNSLPVFVLGGGSNLLVSDEGVDGLVLKMEMKGIEFVDQNPEIVQVIAGAGEIWDELVEQCVEKDLYGLENLSHIPGTVGASVVQNIEAYGVEVADFVESVEVFNIDTLETETLDKKQCNFNYRQSIFKSNKEKKYIILGVRFNLKKKSKLKAGFKDIREHSEYKKGEVSLREFRHIIINIRKNKLPDWRKVGTAGSVFVHSVVDDKDMGKLLKTFPEMPHYKKDLGCHTSLQGKHKIPLGYILEELGWKGFREEDVGVFDKHALIIVNYGDSSCKKIKNLIQKIQKDVKEKTNLEIEPEVVMW